VIADETEADDSVSEVHGKNRLDVRMEFDLKPLVDERLEHDTPPK
jgi:hypothetical protein